MEKIWKIADPIKPEHQKKFAELDPVIIQLLANRGLKTQEEIDEFLNPDYSQDLHDPFLFSQMNTAVDRIYKAIESKEKIVIYGDYDADGVMSSSIIYSLIREIGKQMSFSEERLGYYIPHRDLEGYGLNQAAAESIAKEECELLITTDCGISNYNEVEWLQKNGVDVIIIDHHQVPDKPPPAIIIHTFIAGEVYPFKPLAAAGVAFKVACALIKVGQEKGLDFSEGYEKWFLDMVAIATVTDLAPLLGENRTLEKFGLLVLNKTRRIGLRKLIEKTGTPLGKINSRTVGFQIGPRINAASRIDHADQAFALVNTEDVSEAEKLAEQLNQLNIERQGITQTIYQQALEQIGEVGDMKIIFAKSESWAPGLVGLVAGKIAELYYRPTFVIGHEAGKWIASGRSIPEYDIAQALHQAEEHFTRFGGHCGASGFDLKSEKDYDEVVKKLSKHAEQELAGVELVPKIDIELELPLEKASFELARKIFEFAPFGMANPQPIFIAKDLTVISFEAMGADLTHLKIMVNEANGKAYKIIGFNISERIQELKIGVKMDLVYELGINEWNGNQELQFKIIDFKIK